MNLMSHFVRGGQTTFHSVSMFSQIIFRLVSIVVIVNVALSGGYFFKHTDPLDRQVMYQYLVSETIPYSNREVKLNKPPMTKEVRLKQADFQSHRDTKVRVEKTVNQLYNSLWFSVQFTLGFMAILFVFFISKGRKKTGQKFLRGAELTTPRKLKRQLKFKRKASSFYIGGVPLIKDSEPQHMIFMGSPGVGKTQGMFELLDEVKRKGQKAIIYDIEGVFMERYFDESKDFLLNPLDERDAKWSLWADIKNAMHIESLSASLIPQSRGNTDPFWEQAARVIFEETVTKLIQTGETDTEKLLHYVCKSGLEDLQDFLKGTYAETLLSSQMEKTALSVKAILNAHLKRISLLCKPAPSFSIRDWVQRDDNSWLFITSREDMHESLKPLITTYIDIVSNSLLTLSEDRNRRIWFVTDEIHTLGESHSYMQLLARGRKRGVCVVAGLQSMKQMDSVFGRDGAQKIASMFATRILFRNTDPETANWISVSIGDQEVQFYQEGVSYGAHAMRDGVSLSKQIKTIRLVMKDEIMRLPNLEGYLQLPGPYPTAKIELNIKPQIVSALAYDLIDDAGMKIEEIEAQNPEIITEEISAAYEPIIQAEKAHLASAGSQAVDAKKASAGKQLNEDLFEFRI